MIVFVQSSASRSTLTMAKFDEQSIYVALLYVSWRRIKLLIILYCLLKAEKYGALSQETGCD
jgi:hypothetical protein